MSDQTPRGRKSPGGNTRRSKKQSPATGERLRQHRGGGNSSPSKPSRGGRFEEYIGENEVMRLLKAGELVSGELRIINNNTSFVTAQVVIFIIFPVKQLSPT